MKYLLPKNSKVMLNIGIDFIRATTEFDYIFSYTDWLAHKERFWVKLQDDLYIQVYISDLLELE